MEDGVLNRFGQIGAKVLFAVDGCQYGGNTIDIRVKVAAIDEDLPDLKATLIVYYFGTANEAAGKVSNGIALANKLATFDAQDVTFERLPLSPPTMHPVFIGNDGHSQVHRALGWRHPAAACEGASFPR